MAKKYISVFDVYNDTDMYTKIKVGGDLTLANIQPIAQNRWHWMISNWSTLYQIFKEQANGNEQLNSLLEDLNRAVSSHQLGNKNYNPFSSASDFTNYSQLLTLIPLNFLALIPEEIILRDKEIQRISNLTADDLKAAVSFLRQEEAVLYGEIGLGDEDANKLLLAPNAKKQRSASISDLNTISQMGELAKLIKGYIYDLQLTTKRPPNLFAIAQSNIDPQSSVSIPNVYLSYYTAPFEISLESMAQKYLGSRDRWFDLVTANNLQPPYADNTGKKFNLQAPGAVNNVIVSSIELEGLAVGSKIGIGSYRHREEVRYVERLVNNDNNSVIIYFSGAQDINKFKPSEGAFVRVYKPSTVKTNDIILIPTTVQGLGQANPTPKSDTLRRLETAFINFGIDIARDSKGGDIIIDSNGNFKASYGFAAVKAAVLNAVRTTVGELPWHPNYGLNSAIGGRFYSTTDEALIFGQIIRTSILSDPRFENVVISDVSTNGTGMQLRMLVKIVGFDAPIPLAFVS